MSGLRGGLRTVYCFAFLVFRAALMLLGFPDLADRQLLISCRWSLEAALSTSSHNIAPLRWDARVLLFDFRRCILFLRFLQRRAPIRLPVLLLLLRLLRLLLLLQLQFFLPPTELLVVHPFFSEPVISALISPLSLVVEVSCLHIFPELVTTQRLPRAGDARQTCFLLPAQQSLGLGAFSLSDGRLLRLPLFEELVLVDFLGSQ